MRMVMTVFQNDRFGEIRTTVYTKITPVGRQKIAALLGKEGM